VLQHATQQDIAGLRHELTQDIAELRQATQQDIAELRHELKQDIAELRQATQQDIAELRHAMREMESRLTIRLGGMVALAVGIVAALVKLL
jgi:ribosomal protein L29